MDTNEYLDMFLEESVENLQIMSDEMMNLEKEPHNLDIVAIMFRAAHTLKGMSGTMGFEKIQKLTHTIENMMDDIRNGVSVASEEALDFMFKGIDRLEILINDIKEYGEERNEINDLLGVEIKSSSKEKQTNSSYQFELSDMEIELIKETLENNNKVLYVKASLLEDCLLKAVRMHMFLKELNQLGEILKSSVTEEEFEREDFEGYIELIFIANENISQSEVNELLNKVSEFKSIEANEYILESKKDEKEQKEVRTQKKDETKPESSPKEDGTHRKQNTSIRVNLDKIEALMGVFEEFIVEKGRLQNIDSRIKDKELSESLERVIRFSTEMQSGLLSMRMIPLDTIFNRFPRMVRQTTKDLNKSINFVIEGAETELDRTVVEELGDPLVHLLRNSLDHGIEMPEERKAKGKNEEGTIRLKAYHQGNEAVIEIQDDGNGIAVNKIREKMIKQGNITEIEAATLKDDEMIQYIFASGMSTAEKITNLSGRGVGLDVVKTKIESLGGTVKVETEYGVGTKFLIVLPLTLSIIQSLLVREKGHVFAVPLSNVVETISLDKEQLKNLMGKQVLHYRDEILNTRKYSELFSNLKDNESLFALIIKNSTRKYALLVDEIIGNQEIVLKPLIGYSENSKGVIGATVLGDGSISFVLDINFFN